MYDHDPGLTDWEGIGAGGSMYEGAYTSAAHGWSTGVVPELTNDLLGAAPTGPGFGTWLVRPHPGSVAWAQGQLPTPHGSLDVSWRQGVCIPSSGSETAYMDISLHDVRQALADLGRLRFGEMSVEDAIREIVQTTHAMFDVDGAGLMLTDSDHHLRKVAASDDRFAHLEDLQIQHDEGPCIAAYDEKILVGAEDLVQDVRWPRFSQAAVARNVRAVLASPLPYNQDAVGVVAVLSEQRRPWSAEGELALLAFTDLAALLIASMMQNQEKSELATQLQGALDTRKVIEQAKGVLIGRQGITARTAYVLLRAQARAERRKLGLVCAEVVRNAAVRADLPGRLAGPE